MRRISLISLVMPILAGAVARAERPEFLAKQEPAHVRLLCYNINWDSIFPEGDPQNHKYRRHSCGDAFLRVVKAVGADVVCLQEINPARPAQQVADLLDRATPLGGDARWQAFIGQDNVIAARWPLKLTATDTSPPTDRGHAMALVDLPDERYAADLYVIDAHLKSAGGPENIARRARHADAIVQWIRDARAPGGKIDLPARTPIVICGDLNVYDNDPRRHLFTLISGDISDEQTYGPDFLPDWDDTILGDVLPSHNARGAEHWTWRDDTTKFNPGPLDHVIYTDSVLCVAHAFVLDTTMLSDAELKAAGLEKGDVALDLTTGEFDHLPIVVDFVVPVRTDGGNR